MTIKDKEILTTREILNYIYDIIVAQNFNYKKMAQSSTNEVSFLKEYISDITPSLMYEYIDKSVLLNQLQKYDPLMLVKDLLADIEEQGRLEQAYKTSVMATEKVQNLYIDFIRKHPDTKEALNRFESNDDNKRVVKYAHMAIEIIKRYRIRLQQRKTDILADTMTDCYKKLAYKKHLIEKIKMDPVTLDIHYLNGNDEEVEKKKLSAGEKQLMVISLLWALAICSKKKLPVIIDTPLSRLDSIHREALISTYFPNASDQTIILSTDSEIDQKYYKLMKPHIGDEFTLVYDDELMKTTIKKGYLFEGKLYMSF